jgi:hypothetical protein
LSLGRLELDRADGGWKTTIDLFFLGEAVDMFDRISIRAGLVSLLVA